MTEPGILPPPPPITPIKHISPSRFITFKSCPLKGVWASNNDFSLLPSSPNAVMGRVIHTIMEYVGSGKLITEDDFEKVWSLTIQHEEEKLLRSWTEKHFVPLRSSIRNYDEKKALCWLVVQQNPRHKIYHEKQLKISTIQLESNESWLKTPDNICIGRADLIRESNGHVEIIDYKTTDNINPEKLEDYAVQLKFYAAIYHAQYKKWPSSLKIILNNGQSINIPFTKDECKGLLESVYEIYNKTNNIINENILQKNNLLFSLASPAPNICFFCNFRPVCTPYWEAMTLSPEKQWPYDISGTIENSGSWGNNRIFLEIKRTTSQEKVKVVGLSPDRHPDINTRYSNVSIFYLKKNKNSLNTYKEGQFTVIYAIPPGYAVY